MSTTQDYARFRKQLVSLGADLHGSAKRIVAKMRDTAYTVTVKNTPVGKYSNIVYFETEQGKPVYFKTHFHKQGGTLKRGWERGKTLRVGNGWQSEYHNNVYYAVYVNNGHGRVNRWGETTGYVKGKRMLEQGIDTARRQSGAIMRSEVERIKRKTGF